MSQRARYRQLAAETAEQIKNGVFRAGDPLPSVRKLSQQKKVSITTVLNAYDLLEADGLIEARERSGYYVRFSPRPRTPEPGVSAPLLDPARVSVSHFVTSFVQRDAINPFLAPLGAAYPDPELTATVKLNRLMASIGRTLGPDSGIYDMTPGCEPLRRQAALLAASSGCRLTADDLVTTFGATEAIALCLRAVCQPGDTVALESPICMDALQALETLGLKALEIPTHPRDGISLEALRFALDLTEVKACMIISNFNNPLGSCMPDENKKELVAMLAERETPLIENDIFGELHHDEQRPSTAKAYDREGLVMLCSSVSKSLCPGIRVGWTAPGRWLDQIKWLKYTTTHATATLPQLAVAEFLTGGGYRRHMRRVRQAYAQRTAAMRRAVIRHFPKGIRVTRPRGGFLLWVQLPNGIKSIDLYQRALKKGVAITPGHIFSATDRYHDFIRLNTAFYTDKLEAAVRTLGALTAELAG